MPDISLIKGYVDGGILMFPLILTVLNWDCVPLLQSRLRTASIRGNIPKGDAVRFRIPEFPSSPAKNEEVLSLRFWWVPGLATCGIYVLKCAGLGLLVFLNPAAQCL